MLIQPNKNQKKKKKKRNLYSCEAWLVLVDASTVVAVRGVSVLPSLCRRRVPCADACTYTSLPPSPPFFLPVLSFSCVHVAVLTGTASFFFFIHCIYFDPTQSKSLFNLLRVPRNLCGVIQSDIRLQTVQRLAHLHGKQPLFLRSDDPIAPKLIDTCCLCMYLLSAIIVSRSLSLFSLLLSRSCLLLGC
jgi:hypothetical protein